MQVKKTVLLLSISAISLFFVSDLYTALAADQIEHHGFSVDDKSDSSCIECHNENISLGIKKQNNGCSETNQVSHPVHLVYPPKGKESKFKTMDQASESGIRFENGKMTCLSCHNLENVNKGHLAVQNKNSRLCMACHRI